MIGVDDKKVILTRVRCKQWDCTFCAQLNRRQWQARMIQTVEAHITDDWGFWTLTAHRKQRGWDKSIGNLQSGWKRLYDRLRRKFKATPDAPFMYARVYERHKDGSAHWHMIANRLPDDYIEPVNKNDRGSRWLSDNAAQVGLGWKTHVVQTQVKAAPYIVSYCTKYMTKAIANMPAGTRRVQTSRGWTGYHESNPNDFVWSHHDALFLTAAVRFWSQGKTIRDVDRNHTITVDDFQFYDFYELPKKTT